MYMYYKFFLINNDVLIYFNRVVIEYDVRVKIFIKDFFFILYFLCYDGEVKNIS